MLRLTVFGLLIFTLQSVMAADPVEESITVTVVGTLRSGIVAIGGETTGTTITAQGIKWELGFGKNAELRTATEKLDGRQVTVTGTLERRAGVEIKERWVVTVASLKGTCGSHLSNFPMSCLSRFLAPLVFVVAPLMISAADDLPGLNGVKRIVFLGDSITYSGQYIESIDAYLAARYPDQPRELLDLGLPSETVSGLSEPGHAGGRFPRPDLHERLERVLLKTKPDLVVACYGMNCGIYYPFSPERFQKFQAGILRLRERAEKAGAKVLHITPPTFDPLPIKSRTLPAGLPEYLQPFEGYNEVLDQYAEWLAMLVLALLASAHQWQPH